MESQLIISPRLQALKKEILAGNNGLLEFFWSTLEAEGTPIVEMVESKEDNVLVTFIYREKEPVKNVVVYGAFPGYRYLENQMYRLLDTDIWFKTYKVRNDIRFKYSFSINDNLDEDYKSRAKKLQIDTLNPYKIVFARDEEDEDDEETEYSLVNLPKVSPQIWIKPRVEVGGGLVELLRLNSRILNGKRRLWVYLPHGYDNMKQPCNLILLMDGFDYISSLNAKTVLDNIIQEKKIPPSVCVFIDNKDNRYEELTCNEDFSKFVSEELIPWIRQNYHVCRDPHKCVIGGLSLGGLAATYIGMNYSHLFGNVLSQSGSFWWKDEWLINKLKELPKIPLKFYLNVGVLEDRPYDDEPIMMDSINKVRDVLQGKGNIVFYEQFQSGHDYLSWGETLANGLIDLLGEYSQEYFA